MNIKALIPNLFTMLNLFCGCVALVFVADFKFELAFYLVCLGIFFDFFDGFFARKFNVAGPLGVQLDSLADMITSGVVPGYAMYQILYNIEMFFGTIYSDFIPFLGFIITLGACYRLAKFNIDTRQSDSFIGLPTPANALFFTSLPLIADYFHTEIDLGFSYSKWILLALTFLSAYVMNAEIPLFSLKIKNFIFAKYKLQIFFLAISVLMLIFLQIVAVPLIILIYVLLSVINNIVNKKASV
ncbi:CDP-alcohol phosphatidyltransferase family protein [Flavobacterium dankookense]|uniref:CDP-diacylglycerol--serine O-phosphatidyltransferase n=1 Tax=Flavobacterium dankookense TaxID=706186 RepID=A0A4R6QAT7_9FLAO|nr:CDP-alcohol phosphatidyltransferase family protein [Flavobacterium dankookense]TDP59237.1 CDP-diacylglycerol--serine O-phosphatidyltransferase [Flavobacterium dankookense]